jgi:UDPglucose 6-dehydrogenase
VLAVVTEWQEFRSPDFEFIRAALTHPVIFDGRNLYEPSMVARFGFKYFAVGRGDSLKSSETVT